MKEATVRHEQRHTPLSSDGEPGWPENAPANENRRTWPAGDPWGRDCGTLESKEDGTI